MKQLNGSKACRENSKIPIGMAICRWTLFAFAEGKGSKIVSL